MTVPNSVVVRWSLALAVASAGCVVLVGCEQVLGPREWTMMAARADGSQYTVVVRDTSGRLENVEIDPIDAPPGAVENVPGHPNVILVPWTGGACDERTDIMIRGAGVGLAISISATVAPGDCDAIGEGHVLRITGSGALPAGAVIVDDGS
jgi:hypothetical protein